MHPLFQKADELSRRVIGAAIEVHRLKGPGLIESIYERCLIRELELQQITAVNQRLVRIEYKGLVRRTPPVRRSARELSVTRTQMCAGNCTYPQSTTLELHETTRCPAG